MEIVKVNPTEFGIEETKATELIGNLPQITQERSVLATQYDEVVRMDIEDVKTSITARELRLKIRDNRTKGIQVWHKTTKDFFLKGGQFVDAIKNKEVAINERMEGVLENIERHFEIKEAERKEKLRAERYEQTKPYAEFFPNIDLSVASDEDFTKALNGAKLQLEAKVAEEKRIEQERIAKEKA